MGIRLDPAGLDVATAAATWRVVGASAEGTSHLATGAGCQDAHCARVVDGRLVIAVADGAGSAPRAREGARRAVDAAVDAATRPDRQSSVARLVADAISAARAELEMVAAGAAGCCPGCLADLATTLTVVVADAAVVAVAQIGDGTVVTRRDGALDLPLAPQRAEYLNETSFVTSSTWERDLRTFTTADATALDGIAVATDGLQLLAFDMATDTPHAPFFEPLFAFAASGGATPDELARFLASERVNARTDDDKTLVVAVRG